MSAPRPPKLEALDWPIQIKVKAFGLTLHLRCENEDQQSRLLHLLPPGWRESRRGECIRTYSVLGAGQGDEGIYVNGRRLRLPAAGYSVWEAFENDVQMFVAEHSPDRVFIHAGVVGWRGQAILIPGLSFSGKSTLTAALARLGAVYYSDEYAVLDARGRVHPYTRSLSIRQPGEFRGVRHAATDLGFRAGKRPLPVSMIVMTRYKSGATWRPKQLTAGQGALALIANAVAGRTYPERVLVAAKAAAAGALVFEGVRGEVEDAAQRIIALAQST